MMFISLHLSVDPVYPVSYKDIDGVIHMFLPMKLL